jgi:hypothetical protein
MSSKLVEYKGQNGLQSKIAEYIGHNDIIPEFTIYFDVVKDTEMKGHLHCRICAKAGIYANAGTPYFGYNTPKGLEMAIWKAIRHITMIHKSEAPRKEDVIEYINALPIGIIRHEIESTGQKFISLIGFIGYKPHQETHIIETESKIKQLEEQLTEQKNILNKQKETLDTIVCLIEKDMVDLGLTKEDLENFGVSLT